MAVFTGSGVAIITPMYEDGKVNYDGLKKLIDFQIAGGTDCIVICGTTGESATLSEEEHVEVIKACVSMVGGRVPVVAGTGSNSTETAIFLTQEAKKAGADAALVVTPYYNKATQNGLFIHYSEIARQGDMPVIMYNVPSRTGVNIMPETAARLAKECDLIVGIKEACGNISQIATLMSLTEGRLDLYSGNDDQVVPILSLGGKGVISVLANIAPQETHEMVASFLAGDINKSREIQLRAMPLISALFCEVNPIPVKKAVALMGMEAGPLRLPLTEMEPDHAARLLREMQKFGIKTV
ncbi:MAG: 4-hydroxy-tetrahydrodipicolinate synthase [Lachnospiraceae bacterium]|nr:4-hydroxy-tetrahydrodipicolinate synthase [Lachnospiraceae bacterium]